FRWTLAAANSAHHGNVSQLSLIHRATQQQSTATHVAASDKIAWETQTMLKILQQNVDVLAGGDTAEQNNFAVRAQFFSKPLRISRKRFPVTRIAFMNVDFGKFAQIAQTYSGRSIDQPARRRDNEHTANSLRRAGEGIGVGKFAAKIKSAEKGEDFTQSRAFAAAQSPGQIELCALAQNHARALAAGVGGRKQKDAIGFNLFHAGYLQKRCVRAGSQPIGRGAP